MTAKEWGKFKDVPRNAGRALYIQQVGIALQGNSRHTAPGGRYVNHLSTLLCPKRTRRPSGTRIR